jgi:hypothetical protein
MRDVPGSASRERSTRSGRHNAFGASARRAHQQRWLDLRRLAAGAFKRPLGAGASRLVQATRSASSSRRAERLARGKEAMDRAGDLVGIADEIQPRGPRHPSSREHEPPVAATVALERGASAVDAMTVGFHDQALAVPHEVDLDSTVLERNPGVDMRAG